MHILLIDDNPVEYELLKEELPSNVFLSSCYTKDQAIDLIKRKKFDLIVVDVILTTENGYEVARDLQPYGVNVLLSSNSFSSNAPICIDHAIGISKQALAGYINKEASKYDRDDG